MTDAELHAAHEIEWADYPGIPCPCDACALLRLRTSRPTRQLERTTLEKLLEQSKTPEEPPCP